MRHHELCDQPRGTQEAPARRPRHWFRHGQDRRPRRQRPNRALRRAHQGVRRRPDAAASPGAEARVPAARHLRAGSTRSISARYRLRSRPGNSIPAATVDVGALVKAGVLRRAKDGVRLLGSGEIKTKVAFSVWGASKSAVAAVERAGGSVILLAPKPGTGEQGG